MYDGRRILCIIPARGGSKRLPRKNVRLFNGKPLIQYAIDAARASKYVDTVLVSTEDEEIARTAQEVGAHVPFMRPQELAEDTSPTLPVLTHALEALAREGDIYDLVLLVQPTVPGITAEDIDTLIEHRHDAGLHTAVTVTPVQDRPEYMYRRTEEGKAIPHYEGVVATRSQDLEPHYVLNGAAYLTTPEVLQEGRILLPESLALTIMPRERSVDIDTETDWQLAEFYTTRIV